jgi:DNA-binding XRE family transcriptional regulator
MRDRHFLIFAMALPRSVRLSKNSCDLSYDESGETLGCWPNNHAKKGGRTNDQSQRALSKKADIPYTTLAKIESDVIQNPSLKTITKIADGLGITLDDLIKI